MHFTRVSVVTVCYDRWEHLSGVWNTWKQQDYPNLEFVIVAGKDEAPVTLLEDEGFKGRVVWLRNAPYYRASRYRNIGAHYSTGEILIFVDCDVALHPQFVTSCVSLLKIDDIAVHETTVAGGDSGGGTGTTAIWKWLFQKIRGYNENLDEEWGYEDTDLFIRSQKAGGSIVGYSPGLIKHTRHDDQDRSQHFRGNLAPRQPKVYIRHMRTCDLDYAIHPFEANREIRVDFAPETVTLMENSYEF